MATIMNYGLNLVAVNKLFHEITLEVMESTLGGNALIPLWDHNSQGILLNTVPDLANNLLTKPLTFYNNRILAIDFSNTNVYLVV
ncbi:hypothetical protein [Anabaena sp. UHCC 0451]|uniref:hypothetical protein n=1 Tax=Anabaena sp. UHCC 0451 TaxID=2055235 RepID=UPI002B1F9559|nr:hypothetical protein [Anabaena sp. UHCC 0451]MEA5576845.1 hypothetical protein [Anabaena sp. UHCC 0451]